MGWLKSSILVAIIFIIVPCFADTNCPSRYENGSGVCHWVTILGSLKVESEAIEIAKKLSKKSNVPFLAAEKCEKYHDEGIDCISVEESKDFVANSFSFRAGFWLVIGNISNSKIKAQEALKRYKKIVPDVYLKDYFEMEEE